MFKISKTPSLDDFLESNEILVEAAGSNDKKIVCYIEGIAGYRKEPLTFHPDDLDPYICTHVIYAYATIDPINFHMVPNDEAYDVVQGKEF